VRNVLVVNDQHLLGAAVKSVLGEVQEITLFGLTSACLADLLDLLHTVNLTVNLDVLILDSSFYWTTTFLSTFAYSQELSGVGVIVVDTNRNLVQINGINSLPLRTSSDLIKIICTIKPLFGQKSSDIPTVFSDIQTNGRDPIRHRRPIDKQISSSQLMHRS
jgi:hypothetical protein